MYSVGIWDKYVLRYCRAERMLQYYSRYQANQELINYFVM